MGLVMRKEAPSSISSDAGAAETTEDNPQLALESLENSSWRCLARNRKSQLPTFAWYWEVWSASSSLEHNPSQLEAGLRAASHDT